MRRSDTSAEAAHTAECRHPPRLPDEPRGYLAWHAWAEKKIKTHHQEFCEHCKRWNIWKPGPPDLST